MGKQPNTTMQVNRKLYKHGFANHFTIGTPTAHIHRLPMSIHLAVIFLFITHSTEYDYDSIGQACIPTSKDSLTTAQPVS